jgi:photosystem II stability/assembly factor-like uncharacterized protein
MTGTVAATTDGGKTWGRQASGTASNLRSVHFVNAAAGWAAGERGDIVATTDGGKTWTRQSSGTPDGLFSVYFVDSAVGWAVGRQGVIVATTDGGKTWTARTSGTPSRLQQQRVPSLLTNSPGHATFCARV